jgi:hypothetical protein
MRLRSMPPGAEEPVPALAAGSPGQPDLLSRPDVRFVTMSMEANCDPIVVAGLARLAASAPYRTVGTAARCG